MRRGRRGAVGALREVSIVLGGERGGDRKGEGGGEGMRWRGPLPVKRVWQTETAMTGTGNKCIRIEKESKRKGPLSVNRVFSSNWNLPMKTAASEIHIELPRDAIPVHVSPVHLPVIGYRLTAVVAVGVDQELQLLGVEREAGLAGGA